MCGEPISSSPSATSTRFTGIFFPAPRIACSAASNAASGPFLIHRAPSDDHLADARLVDDARLERRRGPLGRVELLDVVHEVQADRLRRAGVERREHARLAVGLDHGGLLESGVPGELAMRSAPSG